MGPITTGRLELNPFRDKMLKGAEESTKQVTIQ